MHSVRTGQFFRMDDTRTQAERFVEQHVPAGATVLIQPYSVVLTPSRESLTEALTAKLGSAGAASTKFQIQLRLNPYPAPAYRLIWLGRGGLDAERCMWIPKPWARVCSAFASWEWLT